MSLHDFVCPGCAHVLTDIHIPVEIGAVRGAPSCPDCSRIMEWIPQVGRMDAYEPFQEFTVLDGRNRPVLVDSLAKLRQVERESEVLAANGEGQKMVWRQYSQNRSNRDVNTQGEPPHQQPSAEAKRRFGQTLRKSADAPDLSFGPGVSEANASALPQAGGE